MGRDTGFILRTSEKLIEGNSENTTYYVPSYVMSELHPTWREEKEDIVEGVRHIHEYEVCYWRKIHSLADAADVILNYNLSSMLSDDEHEFYKEVNIHQLDEIIDEIIATIKYPSEFESGAWTFDEYCPKLAYQVAVLTWVKDYLLEHPDAYLVFYDSI